MHSLGIVLDRNDRREQIWDEACRQAEAAGGSIPETSKSALLDEITDLIEMPTVLMGKFDPSFLDLPE